MFLVTCQDPSSHRGTLIRLFYYLYGGSGGDLRSIPALSLFDFSHVLNHVMERRILQNSPEAYISRMSYSDATENYLSYTIQLRVNSFACRKRLRKFI
ncbi:hypothetical protein CDAR_472041 [Caerostris darwini]|uniref:Uncharacterized protein n=1 Tax=Caerostris darwini TaxID=1538125 RepID=A0AAV4VP00_9ARAC|nr:hypothetical protein CDAR_472041 [Caerostris darwini]